MKGNKELLSNF